MPRCGGARCCGMPTMPICTMGASTPAPVLPPAMHQSCGNLRPSSGSVRHASCLSDPPLDDPHTSPPRALQRHQHARPASTGPRRSSLASVSDGMTVGSLGVAFPRFSWRLHWMRDGSACRAAIQMEHTPVQCTGVRHAGCGRSCQSHLRPPVLYTHLRAMPCSAASLPNWPVSGDTCCQLHQ